MNTIRIFLPEPKTGRLLHCRASSKFAVFKNQWYRMAVLNCWRVSFSILIIFYWDIQFIHRYFDTIYFLLGCRFRLPFLTGVLLTIFLSLLFIIVSVSYLPLTVSDPTLLHYQMILYKWISKEKWQSNSLFGWNELSQDRKQLLHHLISKGSRILDTKLSKTGWNFSMSFCLI